jgi:hypothetical protein
MYAMSGWILERWLPAHIWGTREDWNAIKATDGVTPMMGQYPNEGDYWLLGGPWKELPDMGFLLQEIAIYEWCQRNKSEHFAADLRQKLQVKKDIQQKKYDKLVSDLAHFCKTEISPFFHSTSLAASRIRNKALEDTGSRSHGQLA